MNGELKRKVTALFNQGLCDASIAERIGRSVPSVLNYRKELKLYRREHPGAVKIMLYGRIDKMLRENPRVRPTDVAKKQGCSVYEVNKRRIALGLWTPRGKKQVSEKVKVKKETRSVEAVECRHRYYDYAGALKRNLEFLRQKDYPKKTAEEFQVWLKTAEGQRYLDWRYPQLPYLKGSPEYDAGRIV